ncbi:hypothetical protein ACFQL4_04420 [Halosimplex aquaticum]
MRGGRRDGRRLGDGGTSTTVLSPPAGLAVDGVTAVTATVTWSPPPDADEGDSTTTPSPSTGRSGPTRVGDEARGGRQPGAGDDAHDRRHGRRRGGRGVTAGDGRGDDGGGDDGGRSLGGPRIEQHCDRLDPSAGAVWRPSGDAHGATRSMTQHDDTQTTDEQTDDRDAKVRCESAIGTPQSRRGSSRPAPRWARGRSRSARRDRRRPRPSRRSATPRTTARSRSPTGSRCSTTSGATRRPTSASG